MKLPQLSLRDLFWLVLVVALAVAWWVDRRQMGDRLLSAEQSANKLNALEGFMEREGWDIRWDKSSVQLENTNGGDATTVRFPNGRSEGNRRRIRP